MRARKIRLLLFLGNHRKGILQGAFLIRVLHWLPHKKTPLSGFKSRMQLSTTTENLLIIQNYSKFFPTPPPLSLLSSPPPPILKVPREEDKRCFHSNVINDQTEGQRKLRKGSTVIHLKIKAPWAVTSLRPASIPCFLIYLSKRFSKMC